MPRKKKTPDYRNSEEMQYFMIKWARKPAWTLKEAACLACGKNPEEYDLASINAEVSNEVNRQFGWLRNKQEGREQLIRPIDDRNGEGLFSVGSLSRCFKEKGRTFHPLMHVAIDHMYKAPFGIERFDKVDRPVYRRAGEVIKELHPEMRLPAIALCLESLPAFFNNENSGHVSQRSASTISEYLKGLGKEEFGAPTIEDRKKVEVDLHQVVEKM